jgi:hypothetical protein
VGLQVVLEHRHAHGGRTGIAVRPERQIDAEHEAVLGDLADQAVEAARDLGEVLVRAHRPGAVRLSVFLVEIDHVDVGGHVQLAGAELAHADDPEVDALAGGVARHAEAPVLVGAGAGQRQLEAGLGQLGHRPGDVGERSALLDVEDGEPLEGQLAGDAQRAAELAPLALQLLDQGDDDIAARQAGRQQGELGAVAAADALDEAAVLGGAISDGRDRGRRDRRVADGGDIERSHRRRRSVLD